MVPHTYAEAMTSPQREQWEQAMREELTSQAVNHTWTLVELPADRTAIGCMWVYAIKYNADGSMNRFKARLVAKGCSQREGVDFTETFAPVARMPSLRALLAIAAAQDLELHQLDVTTAFLNGDLEEDIYMRQPPGFVAAGSQAKLVCKLNRSLYGLRQAGRAWYKKIDAALHDLGLKPTMCDNCVYVLREASTTVYVLLYVDDLLLASNELSSRLQSIKNELSQRFKMKDLVRRTLSLAYRSIETELAVVSACRSRSTSSPSSAASAWRSARRHAPPCPPTSSYADQRSYHRHQRSYHRHHAS